VVSHVEALSVVDAVRLTRVRTLWIEGVCHGWPPNDIVAVVIYRFGDRAIGLQLLRGVVAITSCRKYRKSA